MANPVHLVFDKPATSSADLLFGEGGVVGEDVTLTLSGGFPEFEFLATAAVHTDVEITGAFEEFGFVAAAAYLSNTDRPIAASTVSSFQDAKRLRAVTVGRAQNAFPLRPVFEPMWTEATRQGADFEPSWDEATRLNKAVSGSFQEASSVQAGLDAAFEDGTRQRSVADGVFEDARPVRTGFDAGFQDGDRKKRLFTTARFQNGSRGVGTWYTGRGRKARQLGRAWEQVFQEAMRPPQGSRHPPVPFVPCYTPPNGLQVHLLFAEPASAGTGLLFRCGPWTPPPVDPGAGVVVPVRRIYIVFNEIFVKRVEGNVEIPTLSLSMQIDWQSWTWSFSAVAPREAEPLLADVKDGDPVELEVTINGVPYRLVAEGMSRDREFPGARIQIRGRGLACMLAAPYAPALNFANATERTARQLMADVLQVNGVGIGWDVDWQLTDWIVSAGAWAHQGTYISALAEIAAAAGGYLQPHATEPTLRVLPQYPIAPWHWGDLVGGLTPDYELPAAVTTRESLDWIRKPNYNRVFVSGQHVGIIDQVTRAGTAGDVLAPMVVDSLITDPAASRQRATAILSDTGKQTMIDLRLQVLPETGIIVPGKSVRYVDEGQSYLGIVRSTSIEWTRPKLRQVIGVQSHG